MLLKAEQEKDLGRITGTKLHSGISVDFYLPDNNAIIEVHGIQHYKVSGFGADEAAAKMAYTRQQYRDDG